MLEGKIWDGKKVEGDDDLGANSFARPWTEVIDKEEALSRLASIQSQKGGKGGPPSRASPAGSPSAGHPVNGGKGGQQQMPNPVVTPAGHGAHVWVDVDGHAGNSLNGDGRVAAEIDRLTNVYGAAASSGVDLAADELLRLSDNVMRSRRAPTLAQALSTRDQVAIVPQAPEGGPQGAALEEWISTWMTKHAIPHRYNGQVLGVQAAPALDESIYVDHVPHLSNLGCPRLSTTAPYVKARLARYTKHVVLSFYAPPWFSAGEPPSLDQQMEAVVACRRCGDEKPLPAVCRVTREGVGVKSLDADVEMLAEILYEHGQRRREAWAADDALYVSSALDTDLRDAGLDDSEDEWGDPPDLIEDSSDEETAPVVKLKRKERMAERFKSPRAAARAKRKAEIEEERLYDRLVAGAGISALLDDDDVDDYPLEESDSSGCSEPEVEREVHIPDTALALITSGRESALRLKHEKQWAECASKGARAGEAERRNAVKRNGPVVTSARTLDVSRSAIEETDRAIERCAVIEEELETGVIRKVSFAPHAHTQYLEWEDSPVLAAPEVPRSFVPADAEDEMRAAGVGKCEGALREEPTVAAGIAQVMQCPNWPLDAEWFSVHGGCTAKDAEILAGTRDRIYCLNGVNLIVGQDYDINMHGRQLGFGQTDNAYLAAKANVPKYSGSAESKKLLRLALAPENNPFADPNTGWDTAFFLRSPTDSFKFVGVQVAPCPDVPNIYASTGSNFRAGLRERLFKREKKFTGNEFDIAKIGKFVNVACGINNEYHAERSLFCARKIKLWAESFFQLKFLTSAKWAFARQEKSINDALAATFPEFSHKCAVKLEPMPHGKPPRIIIADGDEGQVMAMIVVKCFEDLLFKHFYKKSIKKAPKEEAVRRCVKELTKDGACLIEGDGSSWDTTNNERIRDLFENPILWHIMEVLIPYGVCPSQWHEAHMKACKGSEIRVFFRNTFEKIRAVISAIRRSGQRGTSCLNYWENIGNWTCSIFKEPWIFLNPTRRWGIDVTGKNRWWNGCFEGDDSLCALYPRMRKDDPLSVMFEGWWDRMGFYMEIVYVSDRATFVGWHICCKDGQPLGPGWECPDLPRAVANMGISTSPAIRAAAQVGDVKAVKNLAAAKLIAYAANFAGKIKSWSRKCHYYAMDLKSVVDITDDEMSFKATGERGHSFNALEADIERKNCLQTDTDEQKLLAALRCGTTWEELDAFRLHEWSFDNLSDFTGYRASLPVSWRPRLAVFDGVVSSPDRTIIDERGVN